MVVFGSSQKTLGRLLSSLRVGEPYFSVKSCSRKENVRAPDYFNFTRMTSRSITPHGYLVHSLTQCLTSGEYQIS
jgi:hypothetical protein